MLRRAAISFSARGDFERVRAAFELARAGDQRERQIGAEGRGVGAAADPDVGVGGHDALNGSARRPGKARGRGVKSER